MATSTNKVDAHPGQEATVLGSHGSNFIADGAVNAGDVVTRGTNEGEVATAGAGDGFMGVAVPGSFYDENGTQRDYEDGDRVALIVSGVVYLETSEAINAGEDVSTAASGQIQTAPEVAEDGTGTSYDTSKIVGTALEDASASGERIKVRV